MPESRWEIVASLFDRAADLDEGSRERLLADECRDDPALRAEVEALLREDRNNRTDGDRIAHVVAGAADNLVSHVAESRIGERVGAYRLVDVLGHGGMGTVYLAERADDEYRARVAIKFVRGVFAAPELARRFKAERQILADLNHPNIARLLDGGAASDGTPYLVLEYLEGEPIDHWCEHRKLGVRERIALLLQVCNAVEYAHRANVVHRDIKPSNIIVTADGVPKLVDFGVAKLLDAKDVAVTTTLRMLTPAYASPEQIEGEAVTTATDIYSLGTVAFALVAGRSPIDLSGASPREVEHRIVNKPPATLSIAAAARGTKWQREITAELDDTVARALRKRPPERHESVAEFAAELRAYMDTPRRPQPWRNAWVRIRTEKTLRNTVLAVVAVLMAVTAGVGAWGSSRAAHVRFVLLPPQSLEGVPAGATPVTLDVNGDGRADFVWNTLTDSVNRTILGISSADGSIVVQTAVEHPALPEAGWSRYRLLPGDFDGDGRGDLAWNLISSPKPNHVYVALSAGDGLRFLPPSDMGVDLWGSTWRSDVGDLDGDGDDDIVFNVLGAGNVTSFGRSNRDGTFTFVRNIIHPAARWSGYRRFIGDADGDGRDDVIWNDVPVWSNRTYIARSQTDRLDLLAHQDHPVTAGWRGYTAHLGDVNGDDRSDLLWIKARTDSAWIYVALGQPSAQFTYLPLVGASVSAGQSASPAVSYTGDFNGDGRTDLLLHAAGQFRVVRATRRTAFAFDGEWTGGLKSISAIADVDGDGRDDVVWVDENATLYVALAKSPP